jgi:hypothetical protein
MSLRASVGSTEASAATCRAAILAVFDLSVLAPTAWWFDLAGWPFHRG